MKKALFLSLLVQASTVLAQDVKIIEKIWGGDYVTGQSAWSNVVGITHAGKFICSGYLVRENIVMTAAHCVIEDELKNRIDNKNLCQEGFKVIIGNNLSTPIRKLGVLESFRPSTYEGSDASDYGVLILDDYVTPLEATIIKPFTNSIDLENSLASLSGDHNVTIAGWGFTENDEVGVKKVATFAYEMMDENVIFARSRAKDTGSCSGDSGSPAMIQDQRGQWRVIGTVVSNFANLNGNCGYLPNMSRIDNATQWLVSRYNGTQNSINRFLNFLKFGKQTAKVYNKSLKNIGVSSLQVDSSPMDAGYGYFWLNWGKNSARKIKVTLQNLKNVATKLQANPDRAPADEYAYWTDIEFIGEQNYDSNEEKIFRSITNCQESISNCSKKIQGKLTYSGALWGEYRLGDNQSWGKTQLNLIWRK